MKNTLAILPFLVVLGPGAALAGDDCFAPMADWQPRDAVARLAAGHGWAVQRIRIDDGCYRIDGTDTGGRRVEVTLHPATLAVIGVEFEDDDGDHRRRDHGEKAMTETVETKGMPAQDQGRMVRVWDPLVRVFHWGLVAAFAVAWLSAEESDALHVNAGYIVAALVAVRVVWGFVGSHHARFDRFVKGPGATLAYAGDIVRGRERRYLGHNPAAAAMVVALLLALSGTAFTGWLMDEPSRMAMLPAMPQIVAPALADDDGERGGDGGVEAVEELHEMLANLMLLLVALHVAGVMLASFRHHENLARAMVTGDKRAPGPDDIA